MNPTNLQIILWLLLITPVYLLTGLATATLAVRKGKIDINNEDSIQPGFVTIGWPLIWLITIFETIDRLATWIATAPEPTRPNHPEEPNHPEGPTPTWNDHNPNKNNPPTEKPK